MSPGSLTAAQVAALLPHQPPLRLVDEALEVVAGQRVLAAWDVPHDAFWAPAHFPGRPLLPGVLLVEALAQACALVYLSGDAAEGLPVLVGLDGVRLRGAVLPGDRLLLDAAAVDRGRLWRFEVRASVAGRRVAEGTLLAALAG